MSEAPHAEPAPHGYSRSHEEDSCMAGGYIIVYALYASSIRRSCCASDTGYTFQVPFSRLVIWAAPAKRAEPTRMKTPDQVMGA